MKAGYSYPIETLKHWYVAPIGGLSMDLEPGQIGLNREALADNKDLVPYQDRYPCRSWMEVDLSHFSPRSILR